MRLFSKSKLTDSPKETKLELKQAPKLDEKLSTLELPKSTQEASRHSINYLHQLSSGKPSTALKDFLSSFNVSRERSLEVFKTGIQVFAQCANLNYIQRQEFYGNSFLGLHYRNDLALYWNTKHPETTVRSELLVSFCPNGWEVLVLKEGTALVYKGNQPSQALDQLMQGPTILDCAQFCELAIFFGIRYMLGNKLFNESFGKTPFYITQVFDEPIENPLRPVGNSLYPFFQRVDISEIKTASTSIYQTYVANHPRYLLKHPGGFYDGDNCIVIQGEYMVFDPTLEKTMHLTREDVEELLWQEFNAKPDQLDRNMLELYAQEPTIEHPKLGIKSGELISLAKDSSNIQLDQDFWKLAVQQRDQTTLLFNFEKLCAWVKMNETPSLTIEYTPLTEEKLRVPVELIQQFPYENRNKISFSTFKKETSLQNKMNRVALKFCADVMQGKSCCVIFSGRAGIGKTASLICCVEELASRGKKILLLTEVTINGWMEKATDLASVLICRAKIWSLLTDDLAAVFLDDVNLTGYAGKILLEEIYSWYVSHPGKGLLITSNVDVNFEQCYGARLEGFVPAPCLNYTSQQYVNTLIFSLLTGSSLRPQPEFKISELSDEQKIDALLSCDAQQSIGIVVSHDAFLAKKHLFSKDLEFIPGIDEELLASVRFSLQHYTALGPDYEKFDDEQKKWLMQFDYEEGDYSSEITFVQKCIAIRVFEKTEHTFIAIEILVHKKSIDSDCMRQILSIINHAHDHGNKRVIFVNRTSFSHFDFLEKIKEGISEREKERTISRLNTLFFSPYLMSASVASHVSSTLPETNDSSTSSLVSSYASMKEYQLVSQGKKQVETTTDSNSISSTSSYVFT